MWCSGGGLPSYPGGGDDHWGTHNQPVYMDLDHDRRKSEYESNINKYIDQVQAVTIDSTNSLTDETVGLGRVFTGYVVASSRWDQTESSKFKLEDENPSDIGTANDINLKENQVVSKHGYNLGIPSSIFTFTSDFSGLANANIHVYHLYNDPSQTSVDEKMLKNWKNWQSSSYP